MTPLTLLYRGPLATCNFACPYCPFGFDDASDPAGVTDRDALDRLVHWVHRTRDRSLALFFTPWGEALVRPWYRSALVRLSHLPHVRRVVFQTNLSWPLGILEDCHRDRVALWCSYHPGQMSRASFLDRCRTLDAMGIRHSVGLVGLKAHEAEARALREALPPTTYLWINAYRSAPDPGIAGDPELFRRLDPLFGFNEVAQPSAERACATGHRVLSVDGAGDIRRCHFVPEVLGNLYRDDLGSILRERRCPRETCGCHIGYVHMPHLGLESIFGDGILERIPGTSDSRSSTRSRTP